MAYLMIVDDDPDLAESAATALRQAGHEVAWQSSTDRAMADINRRRPDLLILDVMFPENISAGFDFARSLRQHKAELQNMPILMLTAVNARFPLGFSKADIDDDWLPVADFLEKPIDLGRLVQRVEALLTKGDAAAGK